METQTCKIVTVQGTRVELSSSVEFDVNVLVIEPNAETDAPREIIDTWIDSVFSEGPANDIGVGPSHKEQAKRIAEEEILSRFS